MVKKDNSLNFKNIVALIALTMFFILDRYLKFLALNLKEDVVLIKNILNFSFFPNEYIAFSIPFNGLVLNILIGILVIIILTYLIFLFKQNKNIEFLLWVAIFLGAISNFFDRINYSFVVDYLDLKYFTVFNLADVLIVSACFLVICLNFKIFKK